MNKYLLKIAAKDTSHSSLIGGAGVASSYVGGKIIRKEYSGG